MKRRTRGFTLVELTVVILILLVIALFVVGVALQPRSAIREPARRSACANNLGNLIKCCHLYSDAGPNLGLFPMYGDDPNANGLKSLNLLYNGYVKDHRVFSCPSASTPTVRIPLFTGDPATMASWMSPQHTNYGYDPGHMPSHATVGVVADFSDDPLKNSPNHGSDRPGQNVAIGAGSVEWRASPEGIYTDGDDKGLPLELRTFIIQ